MTEIFSGNLQRVWNSTSLDKLKQCPRAYQYAILGGYSTSAENIHIHFGLVYHKAVEVYHFCRAGKGTVPTAKGPILIPGPQSHESALRLALACALHLTWPDILIGNDTSTRAKSRPNLIRSIVWYLDEFGDEDPIETLILEDGSPAVEVTFAITLDIAASDGRPFVLAGHLDRIGKFLGDNYYTDLKTTGSALGEFYFENFSPHNQMSCYSFSGKVHSNTPLKGGIIDAAQIQVGGTRFQRGFVNRTPAQLEEWYDDLRYNLSLAESFSRTGRYPMNDTACRMCNFKRICALDPKVRESFLKSQFPVRSINPLEIRT